MCAFSNRYIGHLKERRLKDQMAKDPTEVIRKAVMRMLPRNRLRDVSETSFLSVCRIGHRVIPFLVECLPYLPPHTW